MEYLDPVAHAIPGVTGEQVVIHRDLAGAVHDRQHVRVRVDGQFWVLPGQEIADARRIEDAAAAAFAGDFNEFREPHIGGAIETDSNTGAMRRHVDVVIDGQVDGAYKTTAGLREAVKAYVEELAGIPFALEEVSLTDLEDPNPQVIVNKGMTYTAPTLADTSELAAKESFGAIAEVVGKTASGAATGATSGFFSGLGTTWTLVLILVAVIAVVLLFMAWKAGVL